MLSYLCQRAPHSTSQIRWSLKRRSAAAPGTPRRQALWWAGALCGRPQRGLQQVYDSAAATLVLPGTHLRWPWYAISHAAMMVKKSDEEILRTCSTSPDAEMPGFAAGAVARMQSC